VELGRDYFTASYQLRQGNAFVKNMVFLYHVRGLTGGYQTLARDTVIKIPIFHGRLPEDDGHYTPVLQSSSSVVQNVQPVTCYCAAHRR